MEKFSDINMEELLQGYMDLNGRPIEKSKEVNLHSKTSEWL